MREIIKASGHGLGVEIIFENQTITGITLFGKPIKDTYSQETQSIYQQFKDYFNGKKVKFDLPLNQSRLTVFQKKVFQELLTIPAGKTITYGKLAERVATKKHSRAVAQALAHNPFPIAIPCHRVVAENGIGGFTCRDGVEVKIRLLEMEKEL